jgi:farnesyl-diphosphate farnesyltransferase
LLAKTSRTFALTIPLLPQPTQREVGVAYLLFRIADTFEDATLWTPEQRVQALDQFMRLLRADTNISATAAVAGWLRDPPLDHEGYLELLGHTAEVLDWHAELRPEARQQITEHLSRTAEGMQAFVSRTSGEGVLWLDTLQDLRDYCLAVAGIVGQMLTELYLLQCPALASVASELRARAVRFGEGLQLVNILKDAQPDAAEGRVYLPRQLTRADVISLADNDLEAAVEYTELLRNANADFGIVAFNALNARLSLATLRVLRDHGPGSKLSRLQLTGLTADVMRSIRAGATPFPEM